MRPLVVPIVRPASGAASSTWDGMNLLDRLRRLIRGERRQHTRPSQERVAIVNRQYAVASRLARRLGTTPEDLLDYRKADRILAGRR